MKTVLIIGIMAVTVGMGCGCAAENARDVSRKPSASASAKRVLYIGDSLSIGPFGGALEKTLVADMGRRNVWLYASCGSSVQHWLAGESVFMTPCGYWEATPSTRVLEDYHGKQRPKRMPTPKVERLLKQISPQVVIVQLGTNHFDVLESSGRSGIPKQQAIFERFASALSQTTGSVREVIWITPPDSSRFASWIKAAIDGIIRDVSARHRFEVIDSRKYTQYVKGKTGGDGVHYNDAAASRWAASVVADVNRNLGQ